MTFESLLTLREIRLSKRIIDPTHEHLRRCGQSGLEGLAVWAGRREEDVFNICAMVIPVQEGIRSDHGLAVAVSTAELNRINSDLFARGLRIFAQIHSHPTEAYHSDTDDRYAIATALGCLSFVVPNFAVEPFSLENCAIYRLVRRPAWQGKKGAYWKEVGPDAAKRMIRIVE